jgi:diamine N-acetyltransferase
MQNNHVGKGIKVRRLNTIDTGCVLKYLHALSEQSKKRFGPHPFDKEAIVNILNDTNHVVAYGAFESETNSLISYSLIQFGYLPYEKDRLEGYGLELSQQTDCTFAPSVADLWQNQGVGGLVFDFILSDLPQKVNRIILWGGVQADNIVAVNYYLRKNFLKLGEFEHNGSNIDMIFKR